MLRDLSFPLSIIGLLATFFFPVYYRIYRILKLRPDRGKIDERILMDDRSELH